jgi:hypothetical protein
LIWAENVENCLVSFLLPQPAQRRAALESACSKNSVTFPQSEHLYSKIGIVKKSKNQSAVAKGYGGHYEIKNQNRGTAFGRRFFGL